MNPIDQERLLIKAARLYYEHDMTQNQIGERLRLSRPKVQRLLQRAREEGIVRISIRPITGIFSDLEAALEERYGLREAMVVETTAHEDYTVVSREVGMGAAEYVRRVVQPRDRIVISWGSALLGLVNALSFAPQDRSGVVVIQGLGGLVDPNNEVHAADLTRRLARALGGQPVLLPAPGVAGSRGARDAFLGDYYVEQVLERARSANLALIGIGAPRPDSLLVCEGNIVMWPELAQLIERGAAGDINLRYFDQHGHAISSDLDDRVIGLTLEEIQQIDLVVGIAGGAAKVKAVRAALEGRLMNVLITDHVTAQLLLRTDQEPNQAP